MFTPAGSQRLFVCLYFAKPQGGCIAAISLDDEHAVLFAMNKFGITIRTFCHFGESYRQKSNKPRPL